MVGALLTFTGRDEAVAKGKGREKGNQTCSRKQLGPLLHPADLGRSCPDHICMGANQLQLLGYVEHTITVLKKSCFAFRNKGCISIS